MPNLTNHTRTWTPARIEEAKRLRLSGYTFQQVADLLKITKGSLMGAFTRYKCFDVLKTVTVPKKKKPPNYDITKQPDRRGGDHGKKSKHCAPLPVGVVRITNPVPWPQDGICRAIWEEPKYRMGCPNKLVPGFSYCADHMKAHYVPNKPRVQ